MKQCYLFFVMVIVAAMTFTFTACGNDDDGDGGIYGTYATSEEYVNGNSFRSMVVLSKKSFTYYKTSATTNSTYWGTGAFEVPGAKGWYVEKGCTSTHSYVTDGNRIVLDNGSLYSVGDGQLIHDGSIYYKFN